MGSNCGQINNLLLIHKSSIIQETKSKLHSSKLRSRKPPSEKLFILQRPIISTSFRIKQQFFIYMPHVKLESSCI